MFIMCVSVTNVNEIVNFGNISCKSSFDDRLSSVAAVFSDIHILNTVLIYNICYFCNIYSKILIFLC